MSGYLEAPLEQFESFRKLHRLYRDIIVTEKIDGTNAQVCITDDGAVQAGSRTRWVTPESDNMGWARWVAEHRDELLKLGPGRHFGEWWGAGIQRRYGQKGKRFSLFNVDRWGDPAVRPACCEVVPTLYRGPWSEKEIRDCLMRLDSEGSVAAPGFRPAEGIVIYHVPSGVGYKVTLGGDGHKGQGGEE